MILYFTGTGNSEYVAKKIEKSTSIPSLNLFQKIKTEDFSDVYSDDTWVVVVPTYAWRIPKVIENWILKTNLKGNDKIYFVMTCGGNIGNAEKYLKKLCHKKSLNFMGCMQIIMPENYIAMFKTPNEVQSNKIISSAEPFIDQVINYINTLSVIPSNITLIDRFNSSIMNTIFYPLFVKSKKFYTTDKCISCGKCVKLCPLNNIYMNNSRPSWKNNCTHCMACISKCPTNAIEYGRSTIDRNRYVCKQDIE